MKIITIEDFNAFEVVNGIKICPTGDYRNFSSFAKRCSFAEGCSFAEWCSFAEGCKAKSPFWSFVYEPPFETTGKIYPTENARMFWSEKLGIDLHGCYDEIFKSVLPIKESILERTDWTKCERRIIESWLINA